MKKVALYDLDPTNGGLAKYSERADDAFERVLAVPPMESPTDFFVGTMLDGEPDAVVVDLPGNPLKTFGTAVTDQDFAEILFGSREYGFAPVPLYPVTPKSVSTDSLVAALALFPPGPYGVCFNEYGVARALLDSGRGFPSYARAAGQVLATNGVTFSLPAMIQGSLVHAVDVLMMPFEIGFPVGPRGEFRNGKEMTEEITAWLSSRGMELREIRGVVLNYKMFLRTALPSVELLVQAVDARLAESGEIPVYMPYSDKGGEGKSLLSRLLAAYLRRYWANGLVYEDNAVPRN